MWANFIDDRPDIVRAADPGATTWLFGHVGDGNVHVNVTGLEPDDSAVDDRVMHYVAELGGSISSEHGIGTAKRPWLHLNRSDAELSAFRRLKAALDPAGILNPNALLPLRS
jgi:FAD/FMN-containing dehydrogenase